MEIIDQHLQLIITLRIEKSLQYVLPIYILSNTKNLIHFDR